MVTTDHSAGQSLQLGSHASQDVSLALLLLLQLQLQLPGCSDVIDR